MSYEAKLKEMGYTIEPVDLSSGRFMRAVRTGNLIFTAGAVSNWEGDSIKGKLGRDVTVEHGYQAARYSALNCLRAIKTLALSLDNVVQFVKVLGLVNTTPEFTDTPSVIHGCSDLLLEAFGDAGRHARSAIGVVVPSDYATEVEMVVEVR
jgi:enamine deaminase RidA (YjgF/YER057c/UK114 family)